MVCSAGILRAAAQSRRNRSAVEPRTRRASTSSMAHSASSLLRSIIKTGEVTRPVCMEAQVEDKKRLFVSTGIMRRGLGPQKASKCVPRWTAAWATPGVRTKLSTAGRDGTASWPSRNKVGPQVRASREASTAAQRQDGLQVVYLPLAMATALALAPPNMLKACGAEYSGSSWRDFDVRYFGL